jgi:hypothetical protein
MSITRPGRATVVVALFVTACSGWSAPAATQAPSAPAATTAPNAPNPENGNDGPELVPGGCDIFDGTTLGEFSPIERPLALIESHSDADRLTCNFVGTADGLDTAVRVLVGLRSARDEGFFRTAGESESEIEIAGNPGVGTGRGTLRIQLDDHRGMTLAVTIRALSAAAVAPRDGEFLAIRDAIATHVVGVID